MLSWSLSGWPIHIFSSCCVSEIESIEKIVKAFLLDYSPISGSDFFWPDTLNIGYIGDIRYWFYWIHHISDISEKGPTENQSISFSSPTSSAADVSFGSSSSSGYIIGAAATSSPCSHSSLPLNTGRCHFYSPVDPPHQSPPSSNGSG